MKRPQKRTALVKGYVTDETKEALESVCLDMKRSVSDVLNECTIIIVRNHLDAKPKRKDTPPFPSGDRSKSRENRSQLFPARVNYGAVPRARYLV